MKGRIRLQTVSQWYLLRELNTSGVFGKRKIPEEVLKAIYRMLYGKRLGKEGFVVLSLKPISDDWIGIEDMAGVYPFRIYVEDRMDDIIAEFHGKKIIWNVSYVRVKKTGTRIALIYRGKEMNSDR